VASPTLRGMTDKRRPLPSGSTRLLASLMAVALGLTALACSGEGGASDTWELGPTLEPGDAAPSEPAAPSGSVPVGSGAPVASVGPGTSQAPQPSAAP
jgi:hypothetical protein